MSLPQKCRGEQINEFRSVNKSLVSPACSSPLLSRRCRPWTFRRVLCTGRSNGLRTRSASSASAPSPTTKVCLAHRPPSHRSSSLRHGDNEVFLVVHHHACRIFSSSYHIVSVGLRAEYKKMAFSTGMGMIVMGFVGFIVKLVHIPILMIIGTGV